MTNEIQEILLKEFQENNIILNINDWHKVTNNLINNLRDVDVSSYYTIDTHQLTRLDQLENDSIDGDPIRGGKCAINLAIKERIVTDIYRIDIESFYPTVLSQLIMSDIIKTDKSFNNVFLIIFNYLKNNRRIIVGDQKSIKSNNFRTFYQVWLNITFGALHSKRSSASIKYHNTTNIIVYIRDIFEQIMNEFNWVYVDTDCIYCYKKDKEDIREIFNKHGLKCSIEPIMYAYFKSRGKYLYTDGKGGISYKGIKMGQEEDVIDEILISRRNDSINEILN